MSIIKCENVSKKFGNFAALDNVSLEIPERKIFGMLGPNGAGKTTLIRIINRITLPTSGKVLFRGNELQLSDIEKIGYLPEERGLYKKMKVGEQALYLARLKGLSKSEAQKELKKWFVKFGIQPWWNKKVEELSKGMAQKIQFITTVLHNPKLIILDEPFSGFDPINVELIRNEIIRMKEEGATIILSTHNMESVEEMCDEIALINKAHLIATGDVENIRKAHGDNKIEVVYTHRDENMEKLGEIIENPVRCILKLNDGVGNKDVLSYLVDKVDISVYQHLLPKMREIFIKLVEQSGGATSQGIEELNTNNKEG